MIHGDLHYENVLAGDREPWLVIDPKPMSGDPHYELAPMLWNRFDELAGDTRNGVRRASTRWSTPPGWTRTGPAPGWWSGGAERDVGAAGRGPRAPRPGTGAGLRLTAADREWVTMCVTIAKAVQD